MHKDEGLDLSNVITFNLDEYYGISPDRLQSFNRWMNEHFFNHVNIPEENINIPNGLVPRGEVEEYCREYETKIASAGGIDVMVLGIGGNGHIGFNEPFSISKSRTRLCTLDPVTRRAASSDFFGELNVPTQAITMGLGRFWKPEKSFCWRWANTKLRDSRIMRGRRYRTNSSVAPSRPRGCNHSFGRGSGK